MNKTATFDFATALAMYKCAGYTDDQIEYFLKEAGMKQFLLQAKGALAKGAKKVKDSMIATAPAQPKRIRLSQGAIRQAGSYSRGFRPSYARA